MCSQSLLLIVHSYDIHSEEAKFSVVLILQNQHRWLLLISQAQLSPSHRYPKNNLKVNKLDNKLKFISARTCILSKIVGEYFGATLQGIIMTCNFMTCNFMTGENMTIIYKNRQIIPVILIQQIIALIFISFLKWILL